MLNDEMLNDYFMRYETIPGHLILPLLFNTVLKVLASAIRRKFSSFEEKWVKLSLFTDNIITHIENLRKSTEELLKLKHEFSKVADMKQIQAIYLYFYVLATNNQKLKLKIVSFSVELKILNICLQDLSKTHQFCEGSPLCPVFSKTKCCWLRWLQHFDRTHIIYASLHNQ